MTEIDIIATTAFGLEAVTAREMQALGCTDLTIENGKVHFRGEEDSICRLNIRLRTAERVFVQLGTFDAADFDQLFEGTRALPWHEWLPGDATFPVRGTSIKSTLHSVPACQSIIKKAIVEKLKERHKQTRLPEDGCTCGVYFSLHDNRISLNIDSTGPGLHKRGYRRLVGEAPLRETLAAGLVLLSYWKQNRVLVDPFCGTGTIAIEAALIGLNRAPGINRNFDAEKWPRTNPDMWKKEREAARDEEYPDAEMTILATDRDEKVISLARYHARQAGVEKVVHIQRQDVQDFQSQRKFGCIICNPPYGERQGDHRRMEGLYRLMGERFSPLETWSIYVLTATREFERFFGRQADRRRKLYNGKIECTYYQFYGPPPTIRELSS